VGPFYRVGEAVERRGEGRSAKWRLTLIISKLKGGRGCGAVLT
jgi:hypothetical protein